MARETAVYIVAIKQILLKLLDDDVDMVKWLNRQDNRSETIRLAIRLLMELDSGVTDLLFELFPDLAADLDAPPPIKDGGGKYVSQQDFDILKQLVHSLIRDKETHYQMVEQPLPPAPIANAPAFAGTKTTTSKRGDSAQNLLDSLDNF